MASKKLQEDFYGTVKSVEGISKTVEKEKPIDELLAEVIWKLRSTCTYMNAFNIHDLQVNATFIRTGSGSILNKMSV